MVKYNFRLLEAIAYKNALIAVRLAREASSDKVLIFFFYVRSIRTHGLPIGL